MSEAICTHCRQLKHIGDIKFMRCVDCCQLKQFAKKEKKTYKIPSISEKEKERKKLKKEAYKEKQHIEYCESCGSTDYPLSMSHTIPVSQMKELENDPDNIVKECFGSSERCHDIWEHGTLEEKKKLKTFGAKIQYISRIGYIKGLQKIFGEKN